jgi:HK97 family phage major capsid protein
MMNLSILNGFRLLPFAAGLNYSMVSDATKPPTTLGWPTYENSSMDGTLTGSAADYTVVSGSFDQYCIVDRVGTSLEVVQNVVGPNHRPIGARGFYMHFRVGTDCLITDVFHLTNHSA